MNTKQMREMWSRLLGTSNTKRNMYGTLGYPKDISFTDFRHMYDRQDIAGRIVDAYPNAIWNRTPVVTDDSDTESETVFEKSVADLFAKKKVCHYLNRWDKLSNLGRYSVLLMGFSDGKELSEEVVGTNLQLNYVMPFSEATATISKYELDASSERYGLPLVYKILTGSETSSTKTIDVHWSRIMHICEGNLDNDTIGKPRLQGVYNRLLDLEKIVGGSAEMFWQNGRGGLSFNVDKDAKMTEDSAVKLKENIEEYTDGMSRTIRTQGMQVSPINFENASPEPHVSVQLDLIAGAVAMPKRILTGSERAELASSQDENNWNARVEERRETHAEALMLRPFIDRLVLVGALPAPKNGEYEIEWFDLDNLSKKDRSEYADKIANACDKYSGGMGADSLLPPKQFVEEVLGLEYREDDIEVDDGDREADEAEVVLQELETKKPKDE